MEIFKRNIETSYKIVEVSGNPKDVRKYLGANKLCSLETINNLCERFETLFAIRKVTTYDNLFGSHKTAETPFIPKFSEGCVDGAISTLEKLGLIYYNTFYVVSGTIWNANDWYVHTYAFSTREDAHKALKAHIRDIEKKRLADIAEQELNNRTLKIHSEEVLV